MTWAQRLKRVFNIDIETYKTGQIYFQYIQLSTPEGERVFIYRAVLGGQLSCLLNQYPG